MMFKLFELNSNQVLAEQYNEEIIIKAHIPLLDASAAYYESSITFSTIEEAQLFLQKLEIDYIHQWLKLQEELEQL